MITRQERFEVRLEVDLEVLAGELQIIEQDLQRMSLSQFLEVYAPERRKARLIIKMTDIEGDVESDGERIARERREQREKEKQPTGNRKV